MKLVEWVETVKTTGGVPDCGYDTMAAIRSASALCWAEIDRRGQHRNETAQLGVKWIAAFMVSCARHGETDLCSVLVPSAGRQDVFRSEAARNHDVIAQILDEAATTPKQDIDTALLAAGAHWTAAPSGRGKSRGG